MRNYRKYTNDDIIKIASEVKNMASLLCRLDLKCAGGNYINMKRKLQKLDIDCSHWTGQGWNKGQRLKDWSDYTKICCLKRHLIKERGHKCEKCNLKIWQNIEIPLEVNHIDGDRTNNKKDNLKLLCPNCHALTPNWRGRKTKIKPKSKRRCKICNKKITIQSKSGLCVKCVKKHGTSQN